MKKIIIVSYFIINSTLFSQIEVGGGMGLSFFTAPDFENYVNALSGSQFVNSFNTSADFFVEVGYNVNEKYQIALEYDFNIYSINTIVVDIELDHHKPTLIGYYYLAGEGYKLKFGGGIGFRYSNAQERINSYGSKENYSTSGIGFLLKLQGDTRLSGNLYALIAGDIRYDIPGEINTLNGGVFNLNSFSVGLKLGTVYYF